ncbi:MAG: ATP-binding protein [Actinomycetota bacterium]|nr:ATP-binding protein [Actinomycetota bacterium]
MKLRTRLTIAVTLIIAFVAIAIGGFAIVRAESVELERIDAVLNDDAKQLSTTADDPLMLSQFLAEESPIPVTITYVDAEGGVSQLTESPGGLVDIPPPDELNASLFTSISINSPDPVRLRSVALPDDDYLLISTSLMPVINARGDQIKLLSAFTLMTMLLGFLVTYVFFRRDTELSNLVSSLEKRQQLMQEFLGDASHELRTPLTVIKGYVELVTQRRSLEPEQLDRYYARLATEIERMESLINDLLLIAELSENTPRERVDVDITSAVRRYASDLVQLQPQRTVTTDIPDNIAVVCVPEHLDQLLANIFSNIQRHTPDDSAVSVGLRSKGEAVILKVADAGPGIPDSALREGIQFFKRFDPSRSRTSGGSGLGMSIMQGIVDNSGGSITLRKSPLGGLEMVITLPRGRFRTEES